MREKDERVRVITEILGGIKVLKLYAWEGSFTDKIDTLRDKEIRYLKIMQVSEHSTLFVRLILNYTNSSVSDCICLIIPLDPVAFFFVGSKVPFQRHQQ